MYKELSNLKLNKVNNLSKNELTVLKNFIKNKPFKVVDLDKNIGAGILDNNLCNNLILYFFIKKNSKVIPTHIYKLIFLII
jgi:hypothetical protein